MEQHTDAFAESLLLETASSELLTVVESSNNTSSEQSYQELKASLEESRLAYDKLRSNFQKVK
jgi:hypothetical protein